MAGRATPPFGCFFGERSLSLILADFGTFRFFVSADFFDTFMVLVSFHLIWAAIPIHPAVIFIIVKGFAKDKVIVTRRKRRFDSPQAKGECCAVGPRHAQTGLSASLLCSQVAN